MYPKPLFYQHKGFKSTAAQQTYKEAKPPRNRKAVKLCIQICVSMLAVASRCRFIYIQPCMGACGEEYGKPMEAVNGSDWLGKIRMDACWTWPWDVWMQPLKKAGVKLSFQSTPVVLEGFAGFLSEGQPHCSLWIDYDIHYDSESVVISE